MSEEKRPETYAELVTAFRQVLGEFEVWLQWGAVTNYAKSGGGSDDDPGGRRPVGEDNPPQDHWREEWERRGDRMKVWEEAKTELGTLRKQKVIEVKPETREELEVRILTKVGWTPREIANNSAFQANTTAKIVRDARMKMGLNPETGAGLEVGMNSHEQIRKLHSEHKLTERQIAMMTKTPKTTVRRALGKS